MLVGAFAGCEQMNQHLTDARTILNAFCTLKQASIFEILLTPEQRQAGAIVCGAIGQPEGTP